jgi:hypothetical protein
MALDGVRKHHQINRDCSLLEMEAGCKQPLLLPHPTLMMSVALVAIGTGCLSQQVRS